MSKLLLASPLLDLKVHPVDSFESLESASSRPNQLWLRLPGQFGTRSLDSSKSKDPRAAVVSGRVGSAKADLTCQCLSTQSLLAPW